MSSDCTWFVWFTRTESDVSNFGPVERSNESGLMG